MPFKFTKLKIPEIILIESVLFKDERGCFMEVYKYSEFAQAGINEHFLQSNYSKSNKGVIRGLHYQKLPNAQSKIVRCLKGKIFDVAVDIRKNSPTYGKWIGVILSAQNKKQLYIPVGFAHGFCSLDNETEVVYRTSNEYSPSDERAIAWNDPEININWPIKNQIISEKDKNNPPLRLSNHNFIYEQ